MENGLIKIPSLGTPGSAIKRPRKPAATPSSAGGAAASRAKKQVPPKIPTPATPVPPPAAATALPVSRRFRIFFKNGHCLGLLKCT